MKANRCLHSVTGWIKKGYTGHVVVQSNRLTGKKKEAR